MDWEKDPNFGSGMVQLDTRSHFLCNLNPRDLVSSSIDAFIVFQYWRLCGKRSSFFTTKVLICSSLDVHYLTWPTFVFTVLPVQIFILSHKAIKICSILFLKLWLADHQLYLHVKLSSTRFTSLST